MVETEKERQPMTRAKTPFDESELTAAQRDAVAVAKAQGKDLSLTIKDLKGDMDAKAVDELMAEVMELRRRPAKNRGL